MTNFEDMHHLVRIVNFEQDDPRLHGQRPHEVRGMRGLTSDYGSVRKDREALDGINNSLDNITSILG